jgi:beta-lactamase regulating signal transducer with metallopeptidase domain
MPEAVAGLSSGVTVWLLTYLLHSTVLVAGAWLWSRFLTARPAVRDALWRVALVGGVVTATASTAVAPRATDRAMAEVEIHERVERLRVVELDSVARRGPRGPSSAAAWQSGTLTRAVDVGDGPVEARLAWSGRGVATSPECRSALEADRASGPEWIDHVAEACRGGAPFGWTLLFPLLWLVGATIGLVSLVRGVRALRDLEPSFDSAGPRAHALLASLNPERTGRVRPRLLASSALTAPCVLPGRRIALPERCEAELSSAELRAVLAHEVAHLERSDVLWTGLLRALVVVFWVQPLNRLALSCAVQAGEEVCDDWALSKTGERLGLARSISRVAQWATGRPPDPVPVSMAGRREGALSSRVRRILDEPQRTEPRWTRVLAGATLLVPLLWLPAVSVPGEHMTAVVMRERTVEASAEAHGDEADIRIFVAKIVAD